MHPLSTFLSLRMRKARAARLDCQEAVSENLMITRLGGITQK